MSKIKDGAPEGHEAATDKTASGLTIYLMEELTDARLRCSQLKQYIDQVLKMVDDSDKKDHFFEVAGQLIHAIPDTVMKLEKALGATALAASRLDYEELKQELKPEKLEELENVLQDVRIRYLNRRSDEATMSITPKVAAKRLNEIAKQVEATGDVKTALAGLASLINEVEPQSKAGTQTVASMLRALATDLTSSKKANRNKLTTTLRQVFAQTMLLTDSSKAKTKTASVEDTVKFASLEDYLAHIIVTAGSREEVMDGFAKANPNMSDEDLEEAADMWEKNKDVVKDKSAAQDKEDVKEKFKESNPDLSEKQLDSFADNWEKNKDVVKDKNATDEESVKEDFKKENPKLTEDQLDAFAENWSKNKDVVKDKSARDVTAYYSSKPAKVAHVDLYYTRKGK